MLRTEYRSWQPVDGLSTIQHTVIIIQLTIHAIILIYNVCISFIFSIVNLNTLNGIK